MMLPFILLMLGWSTFYGLHSVLALNSVKDFTKKLFQHHFPYYRLAYNVFNVLLFVLLVWFQFSLSQDLLISQPMFLKIIGSVLFIVGLGVLWISFSSFNKREFIGLEQLDTLQTSTLSSEKKLVKTGFYGYVRHPLYFGVILLLLGALLFLPNLPMLIFVMVSLVYLPIGVSLEEKKLVIEFGEQYRAYQREVKMLIPFLF